MVAIFTFEMSFVRCVLSDHYVFLLHLLHSSMHIYLQNRCTDFSKQRIQKKTLHSGKGKGPIPFHSTRIQCSCTLTPYAIPKCLQHHIFLLNPTQDYYCSFCTLICVKHVFHFYSCYNINYNNTLESFLDEISVCHAMQNYDVMFVVNPMWHCSLFEKQQDMSKICYGIP